MPNLLAIIVEKWKTGFKGISALEIRDILGISHEDAIARLRALKADGAIALRECRLGEPSKFNEMSTAGVSIKVPSEWEMVDTLMAFPSPAVLDDAFHKDRVDDGELIGGEGEVHGSGLEKWSSQVAAQCVTVFRG